MGETTGAKKGQRGWAQNEEGWGLNGEEKAEKCKISSNWLQKGIMQPNNVGMGNKQQRGVGVDEEEERADNKEANFRRQQGGKQPSFKYGIKIKYHITHV